MAAYTFLGRLTTITRRSAIDRPLKTTQRPGSCVFCNSLRLKIESQRKGWPLCFEFKTIGNYTIMPSAFDLAKRALVALLQTLAAADSEALQLQSDTPDSQATSACRKVSRKTRPGAIRSTRLSVDGYGPGRDTCVN